MTGNVLGAWLLANMLGPLLAVLLGGGVLAAVTVAAMRRHSYTHSGDVLDRLKAEGGDLRDRIADLHLLTDRVRGDVGNVRDDAAHQHDLTRRVLEHPSTYTGPQEQQQWGRGPKPSPTSSTPAAPETPSPMTFGSPLTTPSTVSPPPPPPPPTLTAPVQLESPAPTATRAPGSVDRAPNRVGTHRRVQ